MKNRKNPSFVDWIVRFIRYSNSFKLTVIKNYLNDFWFIIDPVRIKKVKAGFLLYVSPDGFGRSILKGVYDERETKLIKRLNLKGKTVYDIGAHHGYYSFLFSKHVGKDGKVFSFEPSPRERFFFKISSVLNNSKNIFLIPFGVSSRDGRAVFYQAQGNWTGFNSLRQPSYPEGYEVSTKKIDVTLTSLDNFIKDHNAPSLIKVDVEGAEFSIIKGAKKLIKSNPPLLLMEMDDKRSKAWGYKIKDFDLYLHKFGYSTFRITEQGCLEKAGKQSSYEGNYFLVPRKSLAEFSYLFDVKYPKIPKNGKS